MGCLWHQGDAASSTALSQCQTFPAFSGNEFSPCLVFRAGKPGRCGAFTRLSCFGVFLPSRPTEEWLRSRLNYSCVRDIPGCKGNSMLLGMGHPNPVGIRAHHPEAGERLDSEETLFQHSLWRRVKPHCVCEAAAPLCHPAVSRKQQPFQQGL